MKQRTAPEMSAKLMIAALRRRLDEEQAAYTRNKLAGNEHEARFNCGKMAAYADLLQDWFDEGFCN